MRRSYRYLLAPVAGTVVGVVSYIGVLPVVDAGLAALVTVFNAAVWTVAVGLYASVHGQLNRSGAGTAQQPQWESAKVGGISGGVASLGVTGTMGLFAAVGSFRFGAAVGLFVFGVVIASMAVGMLAVIRRFDGHSGPGGPGIAADPAD
ncbi:hypothetical protein NDI56_07070 [Haloarcula sp. S1CR25-12]|uniref:Sterol desaturase family protein n=1 Tax=Haloarcula saliterrae TaxID=2950534 RepID=A0ABU2FAA1_9EURY|nr:hypothetical protein [Haloarcula sp. S1CR25-12]MDS0259151.1 hypothetical protein [Haloarcula sp. S1CR25-12]